MNFQVRPNSIKAQERPPFECVALLLQGGGALGAYQAGVYEALAEADIHPDWVAGISIGAINSAIIAGNAPEPASSSCAVLERSPRTRCGIGQPSIRSLRRKRRCAQSFNQMSATYGRLRRRRLFLCGGPAALAAPGRHARGDELLRHQAPQAHAGAARRLRPHQCRDDALQRRRGQCADRQLRLFRQHHSHDRPGARDGERLAAARLPGRRDRGRALLGRRPHLEHAAAVGG